jgi:hypothetical protein
MASTGPPESPQEQAVRWGAGRWHSGLPALAATRLLLGVLMLLDADVGVSWKWVVVGQLLVSWLTCLVLPLTKGADTQLTLITYSAIALTLFSDTPAAATYCLYFLTIQLCLAYFAAGFHKLRSPYWRSGYAIAGILSTRLFGFPRLAVWLDRRVWVSRPMCWATILWETTFPVVLVAPREVCWFYLASGITFHVSTAFTMGLNKFLWAFVALYPAAIYCTTGSLLVAQGGTF